MISIFYNGIILKDCEIRQFDQQIIRDMSGTDRLYSRFTIRVSATLIRKFDQQRRDPLIYTPNDGISYTTVECMQSIASALNVDRQDFWLVVGGQETVGASQEYEQTLLLAAGQLEVGGSDQIDWHPDYPLQGSIDRRVAIDVENGPHTLDVKIDQIYGGRSMRVSATFKICRVLCKTGIDDTYPPTGAPNISTADEVLSNRWSLSETKDAEWRTIKTIEGTVRTRSAYFFAQNYRQICVPPLLRGYKRVSQRYVSDPTDTVLKYSIVDRQEHAAPPAPAIDWNATHTESTTANMTVQTAAVSVRLTGPPDVDKKDLLNAAFTVAGSRILATQALPGDKPREVFITNSSVIDHMHQPVVEVNLQARYTTSEYKYLAMRIQGLMTKPLEDTLGVNGYHPKSHPVPLAYDSDTPAGIFACYLQHPCSQWHAIGEHDPIPNELDETRQGYEDASEDMVEYPEPTPLEEDQNLIYDDSDPLYNVYDYPYTLYQISTTYENGRGKLHLPLAVGPSATGPAAIVAQVHGGITRRVVEINAVRDGRQPMMPYIKETLTDPNGIEEHLLDTDITTRPPEQSAEGIKQRFGIAIKLTYGLLKPVPLGGILQAGALPIDVTQPSDTDFNQAALYDTKGKILRIEE